MDELSFRSRHVPAFGSWDCSGGDDDLPFTQCFESARQAGMLRCSYSEDRDLYVSGDLYQNDVVTPAMIVVPRHRRNVVYPKEKEKDEWVLCSCEGDLKAPPSPVPAPVALAPPCGRQSRPKAVDDDLYRISPEILHGQAKRKRGWGLFPSCLRCPPCLG